jgi:hypothetical protein
MDLITDLITDLIADMLSSPKSASPLYFSVSQV